MLFVFTPPPRIPTMPAASRIAGGHHVPPDREDTLITMVWVLTSVALATVVLRIFFRSKAKVCGWADVFMVIAMVR